MLIRQPPRLPTPAGAALAPLTVRDEEGNLSDAFRSRVEEVISARDVDALKALASDLHEADMGDLIEELDADERRRLIEMLGPAFDFNRPDRAGRDRPPLHPAQPLAAHRRPRNARP